uniref:Ig-like domain-containing protein n=1 Tax=Labrus bergylta TaxID=56723 RepID=A0A3Q3G6L3_9LABR
SVSFCDSVSFCTLMFTSSLEHDVTPPTVRVLPASPKECGHQSKTIVCVASGFYPDHVSFSWTDKEGEVSSGVATDSEAVLEEGKTYMMSSRLRVSAEEWNNPDNEFTCTVRFFDGDKTRMWRPRAPA